MMLNPTSPIPLYHQLADLLTGQIRSGTFKPGQSIPSETGMAKTYGIGRPTVRQAIEMLVKKGLVERKRGSGTYVKQPAPDVDLFSLAGTSQAFSTKGIKIKTSVIEGIFITTVQNDPQNVFENKNAYYLSRRTSDEKGPVLLENIWLHPSLFPGLDRFDMEDRSLSQIVSDHYYLEPVSGRQSFKISCPDEEITDRLGIKKNTPVLEVSRTLDFPNVMEAVFSRLYCLTERFAFSQTIQK